MSGSLFIIVLILLLFFIGGCITWIGLGFIERDSASFFGKTCIAFGNSFIFFPLALAVFGHGMLAYTVGSLISAVLCYFLITQVATEE